MGLLNFADLSRDAAMPQTTLQRYWALFEATFLVRLLPPWHANLGLRLVKSPKVLLGDTGLLCHLLGLDAPRLRADDLMTGAVLESFVAGELTRQISWSKTRPGLFHYRTHTQQEVDFVLEDARGRLVGIEIKKTASPTSSDFKGLRHLAEHTGKRFLRGLLLYSGSPSVAFGSNLYAVPTWSRRNHRLKATCRIQPPSGGRTSPDYFRVTKSRCLTNTSRKLADNSSCNACSSR
jgi:predicted AAA+ superfamily ATPase